jgi:hypothetical protein
VTTGLTREQLMKRYGPGVVARIFERAKVKETKPWRLAPSFAGSVKDVARGSLTDGPWFPLLRVIPLLRRRLSKSLRMLFVALS